VILTTFLNQSINQSINQSTIHSFIMTYSTFFSGVLPQITIEVVDTVPRLLALLYNFNDLTELSFDWFNSPALYLDLEGINLGRNGSISIMSLYIKPLGRIYLIDVHRLDKATFSTANSSGISLKTLLESSIIPKVIFDIRNDSDALFSHYRISVNGIIDLQLMELASRKGSVSNKKFVAGLAKCIELDSIVSASAKMDWKLTKDNAREFFRPEEGGRYEIFNERPMSQEIIQYCAGDVALLPGLYQVYNAKLESFWQDQMVSATKDRITLSQGLKYDGQALNKVYGPWEEWSIQRASEQWNEDLMDNMLN
jgi:exonuclease 3'-5' domain-containing protein 1